MSLAKKPARSVAVSLALAPWLFTHPGCVSTGRGRLDSPVAEFEGPRNMRSTVRKADPDSLRHVVVVHGTGVHKTASRRDPRIIPWWQPGSLFCAGIQKEIGANGKISEFCWTGENAHEARLAAAEQLARKLERLRRQNPEEHIFVVGHSHGGNVSLAAINRCETGTVQGVVLLANPHMGFDDARIRARTTPRDGDVAEGEHQHGVSWLYWGQPISRVSGPIWNIYSMQDSVQNGLSALFPGLSAAARRGRRGQFRVFREYTGPGEDNLRNGLVNWRRSGVLSFAHGIKAHGAMHSEKMGHLVGYLIARDAPFDEAMRECGFSPHGNEVEDTGVRVLPKSGRLPTSGVPRDDRSGRDYQRSPYRVNLGPCRRAPVGVLLVHGFTAAPTEMRPLARYINAHEPTWAISCVQLPGHGTSVADLAETTDADWMDGLRAAYDELHACSDRVVVVGLSMGAALSCRLVAQRASDDNACLIMLSPVFDLPWPSNWLLDWYGLFKKQINKATARATYYERHELFSYMSYPVDGLKALRRNGRAAWEGLPRIQAPTLIVAGQHDGLVNRRFVHELERRLGADVTPRRSVETLWAPGSTHILTVEPDAERIFDACLSFMRRWTRRRTGP